MFIRFLSERSPDLGSEATDRHDIISKDAQGRVRAGLGFLSAVCVERQGAERAKKKKLIKVLASKFVSI